MNKIDVGSRWQGKDENYTYWIEFHERQEHPGHRHTDIWWAGKAYVDGSDAKFEWFTSYPMARNWLNFNGRMKRVK